MRSSLRWRLFTILAVSVLLAWIATAFFTYLDARKEIGMTLDSRLVKAAEQISMHLDKSQNASEVGQRVRDYTGTVLQVWNSDGTLLLDSSTAPEERLGTQRDGFESTTINGVRYRVYSQWDKAGHLNVRVGEQYELRDALAESVASHLLHPLYFAVPVLGLLIWLSVGAGLAPLSRFTREVKQREPDKLDPLDLTDTPREVMPLQDALNALFGRLQVSLEHERRFTADAAHELRTPLAAIKTQAQVAFAARDPRKLEHALDRIVSGTDRAAHLIEQLLVLSQVDSEQASANPKPVKLSAVVNECVASHAQAAIRKGVDLGFEAADDGAVLGDATLLGILVRNLVDNAVRYTPAGGQVDVRIKRVGEEVVLLVVDTGPGIPEKARNVVVSRFYRGLGSGEEGSGLGLSIVERIAHLHGASLRFDDNNDSGEGLIVSVRFKAASE
ncbi:MULTISPECIES: ATP-binding protein [Marinobacter]|uniref:histidine kinase n=1 Tax=Marinobacter xiaoshiensis TaxID=3073652 RepID=A0ABU2HGV9_9GAMM|nr:MULTISPECIES: ATP-binding protein [unclassified Marinobacter]MBK1887864.1 sensor histidine kinase N-terminal domain-containing protein [Marinobacter sp. DY40_1A1]MDS1310309.1 ATP-binding protein [Marinobacter sp. F60267]